MISIAILIVGMILVVYVAHLWVTHQSKPWDFTSDFDPGMINPALSKPKPIVSPPALPPPTAPEEEPEEEQPPQPPKPPRIWAILDFNLGQPRSTYDLTEDEYQDWLEQRRQRQEERAREQAAIRQARQQAQAEAQAQQEAIARAKAEMSPWLIDLAGYYQVKEFHQLTLFGNWVALILQFALARFDGNFPVKPVWKSVIKEYGHLSPDPRFTSYVFFQRLNERLIEQRLIDRGAPGIPAKIVKHRLPRWVTLHDPLHAAHVSRPGQNPEMVL